MAQIWQLSCAVKLFSAEVTKMRVIMMTAAIYFGEPVFATGLAIVLLATPTRGLMAFALGEPIVLRFDTLR
jgi:hypothetical protein